MSTQTLDLVASETDENATSVDPEELLAQEFGLTKKIVSEIWDILDKDVQRELAQAQTILWREKETQRRILEYKALKGGKPRRLRRAKRRIKGKVACEKCPIENPSWNPSWNEKVRFAHEINLAFGSPLTQGETTLNPHQLTQVLRAAHLPANIRLKELKLPMVKRTRGFTIRCGLEIQSRLLKDLVTAFGFTNKT